MRGACTLLPRFPHLPNGGVASTGPWAPFGSMHNVMEGGLSELAG